jgi:hypothetical protein
VNNNMNISNSNSNNFNNFDVKENVSEMISEVNNHQNNSIQGISNPIINASNNNVNLASTEASNSFTASVQESPNSVAIIDKKLQQILNSPLIGTDREIPQLVMQRDMAFYAAFAQLPQEEQIARNVESAFKQLGDFNLKTPLYCGLIKSNPQYALPLAHGILGLRSGQILTLENLDALMANPQYAEQLGGALTYLAERGLLTDAYRQALIDNASYCRPLSHGIHYLHRSTLQTNDNVRIVLENPQFADNFVICLEQLKRKNILSSENRQALIDNMQHTEKLASGMGILSYSQSEQGLLTDQLFKVLVRNAPLADKLGFNLSMAIMRQDPKEVDEELINNAVNAAKSEAASH